MPNDALRAFSDALRAENLSEGTITLYTSHVRSALACDPPESRLLDRFLAPKTLAAARAALLAWARHAGDVKLADRVRVIAKRLPKAVRATPKVPLPRADWFAIIDATAESDETPAVKAVIGLMAERGLRVGDAVRIRRIEIERALGVGILSFVIKGNKRVEYTVTENFRPHLAALAKHKDFNHVRELVAPGSKARQQAAAVATIERRLRAVAEDAGLDADAIHPHRLRRTYAVEFLKTLVGDPEALMSLKKHMQWDSIETAAGYVDHVSEDKLRGAEKKMFDRRK